MAAKIGILGEDTGVTIGGFVTVYTVPADKASRVRILFAAEGGAAYFRYRILVGSPGSEGHFAYDPGANEDVLSGSIPQATPDPALSVLAGVSGMHSGTNIVQLETYGSDYALTPYPADYFLSTGDTVRYTFMSGSTAPLRHLIQVVGVEDDA